MKKKLLIVDDHPVVLEGLFHVLTEHGYEVIKALSTSEAMEKAATCKDIDLVVVDLTIKDDADGLDLIKSMRRAGLEAPAIVYTMHEELWNISLLLEANIEGIVLKGEKIDELLEAIKIVGEGGVFRSPVFKERLNTLKASSGILTRRDIDILDMISNGGSTNVIAEKMCISLKAVEYHRSNIMKKLNAKNMTQAICNAVKLGIISSMLLIISFAAKSQEIPAPNAVDLGLSVKWADRNLGAASPLEAGGYYAFGETAEKEEYNWTTYQHCDDGDLYLQHYLGEESICGTEYDAAHVLLGGGWRMPTLDELQELLDNCTVEFIAQTDDSYAYARISAPNGEYIAVPISGYKSNGRILYENRETDLVSGTLESETEEDDGITYRINTPYVLGLAMPKTTVIVQASAHLGYPIRPVYDAQSKVDFSTSESIPESIYSLDGRKISSDLSTLPSGIYIRVSSTSTQKFIK